MLHIIQAQIDAIKNKTWVMVLYASIIFAISFSIILKFSYEIDYHNDVLLALLPFIISTISAFAFLFIFLLICYAGKVQPYIIDRGLYYDNKSNPISPCCKEPISKFTNYYTTVELHCGKCSNKWILDNVISDRLRKWIQ